jgi:hypothetical protein
MSGVGTYKHSSKRCTCKKKMSPLTFSKWVDPWSLKLASRPMGPSPKPGPGRPVPILSFVPPSAATQTRASTHRREGGETPAVRQGGGYCSGRGGRRQLHEGKVVVVLIWSSIDKKKQGVTIDLSHEILLLPLLFCTLCN